CPACTGTVPHVGGPVIPPGCPTVLINGRPAARISDLALCAGPPDVIVSGAATVLIGGRPAARLGDRTAHGGVIVTASPDTLIDARSQGVSGLCATIDPRCAQLAEARTMAMLADHTYGENGTVPPGYQYLDPNSAEGVAALEQIGLDPEDLTSDKSPFHAEVFRQPGPDGDRYVVAFRGTAEGRDWTENNLPQAFGHSSDAYDRAIRLSNRIRVDPSRLTYTGHSLGGGLASAAAVTHGTHAVTYNAAGLHANTVRRYPPSPETVDAYYVPGDPLSGIQDGVAISRQAGLLGDGRVLTLDLLVHAVLSVKDLAGSLFDFGSGGQEITLASTLAGLIEPDVPPAYGRRHALPDVPVANASWRHPVDYLLGLHGMDRVRAAIEREREERHCP
ncbi:MAG: hypothetical protein RLZZ501_1733, partial [Pseudomonadota bacterium]